MLRPIAGLDVKLGLRQVLGKKHLYLNMLRKYIISQKALVEDMGAVMSIGDLASVERFMHTAKAVSGTIGASNLQTMAAEIEKMISQKTDIAAVEEKMLAFAAAQKALIESIRQALPSQDDLPTPGTLDIASASRMVQRLATLLAEDDSEASNVLQCPSSEHLAQIAA